MANSFLLFISNLLFSMDIDFDDFFEDSMKIGQIIGIVFAVITVLIIVMVIATNLCHLRVVQPNRTMPNCTLMAIFAEAKAQPFGEVVGADATVHTNQHSSLGLRATRTRQVFGGGF